MLTLAREFWDKVHTSGGHTDWETNEKIDTVSEAQQIQFSDQIIKDRDLWYPGGVKEGQSGRDGVVIKGQSYTCIDAAYTQVMRALIICGHFDPLQTPMN